MGESGRVDLIGDEKLLFEAAPLRSVYFRRVWWFSLFGIPLLVICLLWPYVVFRGDFFLRLPLWFRWALVAGETPIILFALFLSVGHFFYFFLEAPYVRYFITTDRIIIRRGTMMKKEFEIFLDRIVGMQVVKSRANHSHGSIRFISSGSKSASPFYMRKFPTEKYRGEVSYSLEALASVDEVRKIIDRAVAGIGRGEE